MRKFAPIALFAFKRLDTLTLAVEALQKNFLASASDLIIFSDAAKKEEDLPKVEAVRNYLKTIQGFQSVKVHKAKFNKGLATSIIDGVSEVLRNHESIIVLEDDLVTSPNFLNFMNEALYFYEHNKRILSITGYSLPIPGKGNSDVYFTHRASSWGWATWRHQWTEIDWEVSNYSEFKTESIRKSHFNRMGSDMSHMLNKQMTGKLDSWAIRLCFHQFQNNLFSVHPFVSKIENIGFSSEASNTISVNNRFKTIIDQSSKIDFKFSTDLILGKNIIRKFTKPFSIFQRIKYKLISVFSFK